jgi:hypothetical protein
MQCGVERFENALNWELVKIDITVASQRLFHRRKLGVCFLKAIRITHIACMQQNLHLGCGRDTIGLGTNFAPMLAPVLLPLHFRSDSLNTREK